jgi:hypothetical protein
MSSCVWPRANRSEWILFPKATKNGAMSSTLNHLLLHVQKHHEQISWTENRPSAICTGVRLNRLR